MQDWKQTAEDVRSGAAWSVVVSRDGRRVVSSGRDGKVLVWEVGEGVGNRRVLGEHASVRKCFAMRVEKVWVASASDDKNVCIKRSEAGKWVENILKGHSSWVFAVALCEDLEGVVSGGSVHTVRVYTL